MAGGKVVGERLTLVGVGVGSGGGFVVDFDDDFGVGVGVGVDFGVDFELDFGGFGLLVVFDEGSGSSGSGDPVGPLQTLLIHVITYVCLLARSRFPGTCHY